MIAWNCYRSKVFKLFIGCIFRSRRSSMQWEVQQTPAVNALHQIASDIQRTPYRLTVTSSIRNEEKKRGGTVAESRSTPILNMAITGLDPLISIHFSSSNGSEMHYSRWGPPSYAPHPDNTCSMQRSPPSPSKERSIMRNLTQVEGTHGRHSIIPLWCVSSEKSNPSIKRNK